MSLSRTFFYVLYGIVNRLRRRGHRQTPIPNHPRELEHLLSNAWYIDRNMFSRRFEAKITFVTPMEVLSIKFHHSPSKKAAHEMYRFTRQIYKVLFFQFKPIINCFPMRAYSPYWPPI